MHRPGRKTTNELEHYDTSRIEYDHDGCETNLTIVRKTRLPDLISLTAYINKLTTVPEQDPAQTQSTSKKAAMKDLWYIPLVSKAFPTPLAQRANNTAYPRGDRPSCRLDSSLEPLN